jgi:hypothetical protein
MLIAELKGWKWNAPPRNIFDRRKMRGLNGYLVLFPNGSIHTVRTADGALELLQRGAVAWQGIKSVRFVDAPMRPRYSVNKINQATPMYFIRDELTGQTVANYIPSLDLATKMVKALNQTSKPDIKTFHL